MKKEILARKDAILYAYEKLKVAGVTEAGFYGFAANAQSESAWRSDNLQNSCEKKFGLSDSVYVEMVDDGRYPKDKFIHDAAGFGIVQHTYFSRKAALHEYCKAHDSSIADTRTQIDFIVQELQGYKAVWKVLTTSNNERECVASVLRGYEKPADQSEAAVDRRASNIADIKRIVQEGKSEPVATTPTQEPSVDYKSKYEALLAKIRKIAEES